MLTELLRILDVDAAFIRNPKERAETSATIGRLKQDVSNGRPLNDVQKRSLAALYRQFSERQQQNGNVAGLATFAELWTGALRPATAGAFI